MSTSRTFSNAPWEKSVGYCRAIRVGNQIAVTGTAPVGDDGKVFAPGKPYEQAQRCFQIIEKALKELGATREHVIRTRMFVTDISHWENFGRAHGEFFANHPPATSMIEIKQLIDHKMLIEVEADAIVTGSSPRTDVSNMIIAMEKAALDRWCKGDPSGYLEICAPDVTYFDPFLDHRIDGIAALTQYYEGLRGKIKVDRYEIVNPSVRVNGDIAVLTFNYVSYGGNEQSRWNCTEVYSSRPEGWRIIQTHWSFTRPELKP
jgi:isochorismate pyruvate lyase